MAGVNYSFRFHLARSLYKGLRRGTLKESTKKPNGLTVMQWMDCRTRTLIYEARRLLITTLSLLLSTAGLWYKSGLSIRLHAI
jgi:hypothetical protein